MNKSKMYRDEYSKEIVVLNESGKEIFRKPISIGSARVAREIYLHCRFKDK